MAPNIFEELEEMSDLRVDMGTLFKVKDVLLYLICGFGAPANMISFVILSRTQMKSPMTCCLQFLAAFDTLYLLSWFFLINNVANAYFVILSRTALTGSVWTVVLVSLERFVAVWYPLKARSLFTYRRTILCALFITVCAICINVTRLFLLDNRWAVGFGVDLLIYEITRFGVEDFYMLTKREIYYVKIYGCFQAAVVFCIPLVLLCFFNINIYMAVKKSVKTRREMTPTQKLEVKLSKTIIAIVIVFFISGIPILIFKCVCYGGVIRYHIFLRGFVFMYPILCVNSAANFVIYFALRPDFRGIFIGIFNRFSCRRKEKSKTNITEITRL